MQRKSLRRSSRYPIRLRVKDAKFRCTCKAMKPMVMLGILLIVLGGLALAYQGFTYTYHEKVLDVGPIYATAEKHDRVSIPPIFGGLALEGGIVLLVVGAKKTS